MNKVQRKRLIKAIDALDNASEILAEIREEEQEKFDNLSEGLQATEANKKIEADSEDLYDIANELDSAISSLKKITEA